MTEFKPELGQMFFGAPWRDYEVPDYVEALMFNIMKELDRVYWNVNQKKLDLYEIDEVEFAGVTMRRYYWGDEEERQVLPNFKFEDVEIHWYKHPGRSMSVNRKSGPEWWVDWFDRCLASIREADKWSKRV